PRLLHRRASDRLFQLVELRVEVVGRHGALGLLFVILGNGDRGGRLVGGGGNRRIRRRRRAPRLGDRRGSGSGRGHRRVGRGRARGGGALVLASDEREQRERKQRVELHGFSWWAASHCACRSFSFCSNLSMRATASSRPSACATSR